MHTENTREIELLYLRLMETIKDVQNKKEIDKKHLDSISLSIANLYKCFIGKIVSQPRDSTPWELEIAQDILYQVAEHSLRNMTGYRMPGNCSVFKTTACFVHWIVYLKPFRDPIDMFSDKYKQYTNEFFAVHFAGGFISNASKYKNGLSALTPHFYHDFIEELRYGDISPHSIALILESITYQGDLPEKH